MNADQEALARRLVRVGMPMHGERLARAEELLRRWAADLHSLHDVQLMTIVVGAYREPETDLPAWV